MQTVNCARTRKRILYYFIDLLYLRKSRAKKKKKNHTFWSIELKVM